MKCISCGTEHNENFCPNCGEKSSVERITPSTILQDAVFTITSMNSGFFYNVKTLVLRPKEIIIGYINGRRKGIFNPISFLIIAATAYLIVEGMLYTPSEPKEDYVRPDRVFGKASYAAGYYIRKYFKYFWILSFIPLGLAIQMVFKRYNLVEQFTVSAFILGLATLAGLICFPFVQITVVVNPVVYLVILVLLFRTFIKENNWLDTILMSFSVLVIFIIELAIITMSIGLIMASEI